MHKQFICGILKYKADVQKSNQHISEQILPTDYSYVQ